MIYYNLIIYYQGFYIDPQGRENAIELSQKGSFFSKVVYISPDIKQMTSFRWSIVRCEDEKSLFQSFNTQNEQENIKENNIYIGGKFQRYISRIEDKNTYIKDVSDCRYMYEFIIRSIDYTNVILYEDYKRKAKSFLDVLPDVFSLWTSLYNFLSLIFSKFYSKSFDKYKLIENLLSRQKKFIPKIKKRINKTNDINLEDFLIENDLNKEDYKNLNIINDSIISENDNVLNKIENENDDNNLINKEYTDKILPKRRFVDFIYNNLNYFEKCCHHEKQDIINDCKKIIFKYYSIENILFNQILFENLIEDYK